MKRNISNISICVIVFLLFMFFIFSCILFFVSKRQNKREGFKEGFKEGFTWSNDSIRDFLIFQQTVNPNTQFDMDMIQSQASEDELQYLLSTGHWPWSEETKYLYTDAVSRNPIVKRSPVSSLEHVNKIYNENAAKQLLSWNTKEGKFLLNGISKDKGKIKIKCELDDGTNQNGNENGNGQTVVKKTVYGGYNLWNGYQNIQKNVVENDVLPQEIPGFKFVKGPCNPCVALDNDYSCPFDINVVDENNKTYEKGISDIWSILWNLK